MYHKHFLGGRIIVGIAVYSKSLDSLIWLGKFQSKGCNFRMLGGDCSVLRCSKCAGWILHNLSNDNHVTCFSTLKHWGTCWKSNINCQTSDEVIIYHSVLVILLMKNQMDWSLEVLFMDVIKYAWTFHRCYRLKVNVVLCQTLFISWCYQIALIVGSCFWQIGYKEINQNVFLL